MLDWDKYTKVGQRFQYKARRDDRDDLRQNIILELAKVELKYNGNGRTLSDGGMIRVASYVVADYWRKVMRLPPIVSLDTKIENSDGDTTELYQMLADDKAIDVDGWLNARLWLYRCPKRLVKIAYKKVAGYPLTSAEHTYLTRQRKKAQRSLALV